VDLITGATGFIGNRLLRELCLQNRPARVLLRRDTGLANAIIADLTDTRALNRTCSSIETVFHCAGYAHAFSSFSNADEDQHWQVNSEGTRNLVEAAGKAGVHRFVFLSSVKAMAEPGEAYVDEDCPGLPQTAYGQSKRAAEEAVLEAGTRYGMHVVNLRLAMVYGKGGRGNLARMGNLIRRGWFPPLPETGNHRSMVHVDDVVDAMLRVVVDDRANGRTYIIAGPQAPSGRELYDAVRASCGLPKRSWEVPEAVLRTTGRCGDVAERITGKRLPLDSETVSRLLDSAWYSSARIERELGWRAQVDLKTGLQEMFG